MEYEIGKVRKLKNGKKHFNTIWSYESYELKNAKFQLKKLKEQGRTGFKLVKVSRKQVK